MLAILSDIHGNQEALKAVLAHVKKRGIKNIYCLGDVIGYGPNPRECLDMARSFKGCIRGNHEEAVLYSAEDFNLQARKALDWTRDQLNSDRFSREENRMCWDYIAGLPDIIRTDEFQLVHGSPRDRVHEYVISDDVYDREKMAALFELVDRPVCFIGHSHLPGVFLENPRFLSPDELGNGFSLTEGNRAIVNVGSVGQPRDGDPRASYVTVEDQVINFHRVEYDIDQTFGKIVGTGILPLFLASRLKEGK